MADDKRQLTAEERRWQREFEHAQRMQEASRPKHQPLNGVLVEQPKGLANGL